MKKIFLILIFTFFNVTNAQINIVDMEEGHSLIDSPPGTYIKDIGGTFDKFLGTWKYQNGNEILIIKLEKVTQYFYSEYNGYKDFIKGNYSYSTNGGSSYIVDTITPNINNNNPSINKMYSPGPEGTENKRISFVFEDIIYNKRSCSADFNFLPNSMTQMQMKLYNIGRGYIYPQTPPSPNFCIPTNVVLTKQ